MGRIAALSMLALMVYRISADLPHNACGEPPPCANTYRTFPDNNTVEYRCIDTYVLSSGDLDRHCVNGRYNGTCPVCTLNCGPPLNTSYAMISSTGTEGGDKVTYTCPDGFLVSSTETECSTSSGYWFAGDRCFANSSLDVAAFTAVQTSTATLDDILNTTTTSLQLPPNFEFSAAHAVDATKLGVSLANGDCSSTAREKRPHMNVTIGTFYDVFQVAVTLPEDAFAYSLPNLEVKLQNNPAHRWYTCMKHTAVIPVGSRFVATCGGQRYPGFAQHLQLEVDFGDNPGMLQICRIEVFARPLTSVDCGQPPQRPYSVLTRSPSTTYYNRAVERVTYECVEGFKVKGGRKWSYCNVNGYWTEAIECTADDNLAIDKPASLTSNDPVDVSPLTDGNISSCAVTHNVVESTFVIEMGRDVEVDDVSITYFATKYDLPVITVTVWRDGYYNKSCTPYSINHVTETSNVKCPNIPVGRYVSVHIKYKVVIDLKVCEIRVHGRPYNEALECYRNSRQTDYKGHLNVTVAGIPCQRWDSQSPHAHAQTDISKFPDDNLADAANYCRNPDRKYGLWCYTIDPDIEWQYCGLRLCDFMCMQDDKGSTYRGSIDKTSSGASCAVWSDSRLPFKQKTHFSNFWSSMRYCRNPLISQSRPWCFTNPANASHYGHCDIPTSCPTTSGMTRSRWIADVHQAFDDLLPSTECLVWRRLYTTDGNFSATWDDAFKPFLYRNTFTAKDICYEGRVFNTYLQCFNITESGTVWKAGVLECVRCGSAPSVANATVAISSSLLNGTATYKCVTGYGHASGSNRITCLKTGEWEVPDIICEVDCGTPPTLAHAVYDVNSTLVGQTASYACNDGYLHLSVSNEATCLDTGKWDLEGMKCEVNCGDPPFLNRTEASPTDGFVNETVEYTCNPGYAHVSGSAIISCLETSVWEEPGIYCEVDCSSPPVVANTVVISDNTTLNSIAVYRCTSGFGHASGSTNITCLDTGFWEIPSIECIADCGLPPQFTNTNTTYNSTLANSTAMYTCVDGTALVSGSRQVTCQSDGNWTKSDVLCHVDCSSPPVVANAVVISDNTTLNSIAVYRCTSGFGHASGSTNITCLDTGFWEIPSIECIADCGLPPQFTNTNTTYNSTLANSTAMYTCVDGTAHVSGYRQVTCQSEGNWTKSDVLCLVDCGVPPQEINTNTTYNSTLANSTAEYTCVDGTAHASGSRQVTCQADGNWTKSDIVCLADCGLPPQFTNTNTTYNSTLANSTAMYTCVDGTAHVSGSRQVTCQSDGNWTKSDVLCLVNCGSPPSVLNATVTASDTWVNSSAQYACHDGFSSSGSATIICKENGTWEVPSYMCEEVQLPSTTSSSTPTPLPVDKYGRTRTEKCICRCIIPVVKKQEDIVAEISKKLTLDTKTLTSSIMKKESLPDKRTSSHGIAYVAIAVIGMVFSVVFLSDVYFLINEIRTRFLSYRSH